MNEQQTTVAAPSAAPETPAFEVDRGPLVTWTPEQRVEFRKTGNPPKAEDAAPSDAPKVATSEARPEEGQAEPAGESEPPKNAQERRKPDAEARIRELTAKLKQAEKRAEEAEAGRPKTTQAEPSPAKPAQPAPPQNYQEWRKEFKPTKWTEDYGKQNPEASYEEAQAAMTEFLWDVRDQFNQRNTTQQAQAKAFLAKVEDAKSRYENFDEVVLPASDAFVADQSIPEAVKRMVGESDIMVDLLYTIYSNADEASKFTSMARNEPGKALRYIALTESLINDELQNKAKPAAESKPAPVKPQTSAPRPPSEVGGRAATPGDALESAAKANDYRAFKAESLRRDLARLKSRG